MYELNAATYAVGLKLNGASNLLKDIKTINGFHLFSPFPIEFDIKNLKSANKKARTESLDEVKLLRNSLINKDFSPYLFNLEKSNRIKGSLHELSDDTQNKIFQFSQGNVYNLTQENRAWTKGGLIGGTCNSGCTPVSWAMVLEYGDRYGFPNLIGSTSNNSHPYSSHADLRYAINELRGLMNTQCIGTTKGGATTYLNTPNGVLYARARGYPNYKASNKYIFLWDPLVVEINASRPAVTAVSTAPNGAAGGPSVVTFASDDNTGQANDYLIVKTGWSSPAERAYARAELTGVTAISPF